MRSLRLALGLVPMLLALGCAGESAKPQSSQGSEPRPRGGGWGSPAESAPPDARIDVAGVVATSLGAPIGGRGVTLVDRHGERREGLTDEDGTFAFAGVSAPYDLVVEPGAGAPTGYLGLRRPDPHVEIGEREGPAAESQTVRVVVPPASCGAPACWVGVVTSSASGGGVATSACSRPNTPVVVEVRHEWWRGSPMPEERVDAHVLVASEDRSTLAYARLGEIAAAPGETTDLGVVLPAPIPATQAFEVGARGGEDVVAGWTWTTELSLDLADGSGLVFASADAPSMTVRLPLLPGAAARVSVAATHPRSDARGGFHRSAEAWSGARPLGGSPAFRAGAGIGLEVALGPEPVRPTVEGTLSGHGLGFAWKGTGIPALTTLSVADTVRGALRFRVLTTGDEVPLARLAALGLPELLSGAHVLDLTTAPFADVDDATSPDASVRRRRADRARPGATTSLRVPFEVTP